MKVIKEVRFKANAGIKDILGRGLIHDDNVAVLELIKNSKDAGADFAKIYLYEEDKIDSPDASIVIKDNGSGMSQTDIINKWLNMAYSDKKGNNAKDGYYAGNKGVGRFSCDRLGAKLSLYTRQLNGDFLYLDVDWTVFEDKGRDDEIGSIVLKLERLDKDDFLSQIGDSEFVNGTVLKITKLRSSWDERKIKKLFSELEKFSPSLNQGFDIYVYSDKDYKDESVSRKINKRINNEILEVLSFQTNYIKSLITPDGNEIHTTLFYQGNELYSYKALNPYKNLRNISIEIHFLDPLAKSYFKRSFGVSANEYGSIFLFYNNFRVSPYGNFKNDWLSLDQRKSQGTNRNLGTREVFGKIIINDDFNAFSVLSSREGLAQNEALNELTNPEKELFSTKLNRKVYGYVTTIIRQLENFVVGGLEWNRLINRFDENSNKVISEYDISKNPDHYTLRQIDADKVKEACNKILNSEWEIKENDFFLNSDLILHLSKVTEEKYENYVKDFVESIGDKNIGDLSIYKKVEVKKIIQLERQKTIAAQKEAEISQEVTQKVERKLAIEEKRRLFSEAQNSLDIDHVLGIQHQTGLLAGTLNKDLNWILKLYKSDSESITLKECIEEIQRAVFIVEKIQQLSNFATRANFDVTSNWMTDDLGLFISDYITQVSKSGRKVILNANIENPFIKKFRPIEVSMVIDNAINNAQKAGAKKITINIQTSTDGLVLEILNDGEELTNKYDTEDLFRRGVTTTNGSGLGLYHIKKIVSDLKGKVCISRTDKGTLLKIEIYK